MALASIYNFTDFRAYLRAYYQEKKRAQPGFSFAVFSRLSQLGSPNYLKLIMDGTRGVTNDVLFSLARGLDLSKEETAYFEALVQWGQSSSPAAREFYMDRIRQLKERFPQTEARLTSERVLVRSGDEVLIALLQLHLCPPEGEAAAFLARRMGVGLKRAEDWIAELVESKLVAQDESGSWRITWPHLSGLAGTNPAQRVSNLTRGLDRARRHLAREGAEAGVFLTHFLTVPTSQMQTFKSELLSFVNALTFRADTLEPDGVAQFGMQLFPVNADDCVDF